MTSIKTLVAAALLSTLAVASFAQAPAVGKDAGATVATAPADAASKPAHKAKAAHKAKKATKAVAAKKAAAPESAASAAK